MADTDKDKPAHAPPAAKAPPPAAAPADDDKSAAQQRAATQNETREPDAIEEHTSAGTAPAVPDQATVADAHELHEAQKTLAEAVEADKWAAIRAGKSPSEALAEARAKHPESGYKALHGAPENKGR